MRSSQAILLTGGTGYVGGRLIPLLETRNEFLRCVARDPTHLKPRVGPRTDVVRGDLLDAESLRAAFDGIDTAFYLVHSMGSGSDFEQSDRQAAENFAAAARQAGVRRIIYLGGLGESQDGLSPHLRSRQEVGDILRESGVQVLEFRASIIIGSGSLSFELIRSLVQKLPVMIWPRWVSTPAQPIAIEDVLDYLIAAIEIAETENRVFEIGGPDQVSYGGVMLEYAKQRGLKRWTIPVPFLSPRLSSLWLGLVTPVFARIGKKLVESLRNPTIVKNADAMSVFPQIRPRNFQQAITRALANEDREFAGTKWSDAMSSAGTTKRWGGVQFGNRLVDSRTAETHVSVDRAFRPIRRIGGETGWYFANGLWRLRGFLDLLVGGVGMRRGRRSSDEIAVGDTLDFWRVRAYEPNRRLLLDAEMKLPGRAWLEFEVTRRADTTVIRQTAIFDPVGLSGLLYWYGIYPLHWLVFAGLLRGIVRSAEMTDNGQKRGLKHSLAETPEDVRHAGTHT
mgnify:CR=1 FL=1